MQIPKINDRVLYVSPEGRGQPATVVGVATNSGTVDLIVDGTDCQVSGIVPMAERGFWVPLNPDDDPKNQPAPAVRPSEPEETPAP